MKQFMLRIAGICIYFALALWMLDFNVRLLFDGKSLLLVLLGTLLLTGGSYKKGMSRQKLSDSILWNTMLAGLLTSFMQLFSILYRNTAVSGLLPEIACCMRPLFYAFVIQILCRSGSPEKQSVLQEETKQPPAYSPLTMEEIKYLLRGQNLTERELEIALAIWKNMPIKEIADAFFISESTVKKHSTSLYKKLNVANREQLRQYLDNLSRGKRT